jgi:hypothetical protein
MNINSEQLSRRDIFALVIFEITFELYLKRDPGISYNTVAERVQMTTDTLLYRLEHKKNMPCSCEDVDMSELAKRFTREDVRN